MGVTAAVELHVDGRTVALSRPDEVLYPTSGTTKRDWRRNAAGLQLVAPYSLRGAPAPTVSTPITWDEVAAGAAGRTPLAFGPADVLARVAALGDLFRAPAQRLPR